MLKNLLILRGGIGEGSGNLLQCSCLENPRDRGAWWAAVYEVKQSLKQLSSSSSSRGGIPQLGMSVGRRSLLALC